MKPLEKKKVLILKGDSYGAAFDMFVKRGYEITRDFKEASFVVFLGGTDVDPLLYGCERHPMTQRPDTRRDAFEKEVFLSCRKFDIPMVGICRGGQLLNVLSGGGMIQHLGKCVSGDVQVNGVLAAHVLRVDHHQGMTPGANSQGFAYLWNHDGATTPWYIIWYPLTKSFCFQPHPEWGHEETERVFFDYIDRLIHRRNS